MVRPSGRTPHPRYTHTILSLRLHPRRRSQSSKPSVYEDADEAPHRREWRRRAAKAPEHGVEMETEVAVTAGELSLHPDIVDGVELPQP